MSARWKRNTVVATMVLLVCAAVALNWKYTGEQAADAVEETGTKILGEATLVSGEEDGGEAGTDEEAVYTGGDYFASARLTRQQARDNAISLLQEAADQSGADAAVANEASEGIQVLAGYTMKEAQIENLVTAKGYTDCVAFMGGGQHQRGGGHRHRRADGRGRGQDHRHRHDRDRIPRQRHQDHGLKLAVVFSRETW